MSWLLQRIAGNRAVSRLIQTKLTVGAANDAYEQEADQVANTVMSMPGPGQAAPQASPSQSGTLHRAPIEEEEVQTKSLVETITPLVQRAPIDKEAPAWLREMADEGRLGEVPLSAEAASDRLPAEETLDWLSKASNCSMPSRTCISRRT